MIDAPSSGRFIHMSLIVNEVLYCSFIAKKAIYYNRCILFPVANFPGECRNWF